MFAEFWQGIVLGMVLGTLYTHRHEIARDLRAWYRRASKEAWGPRA